MSVNRGRAWGWAAIYKGQTGQWAQLLHRITGLGVALFLLLHVIDTSLLGWGPQVYDAVVQIYHQPISLVIEVLLAAAVIYHAVNGIRVTIIDFWDAGSLHQETIFWIATVIFVVLWLPTAYVMLLPIFR
ncbi:MAG TPA: succinate dehydrogenase, cytochrome b556 subunit [Chloroflexota bacterium]